MSKIKQVKVCPFPFSKVDVNYVNEIFEYVPCCSSWLTDEYHQLFKHENLNPSNEKLHLRVWNNKQAQELRKSIYDGSYKYCRVDRCNKPLVTISEIKNKDSDYFETPISDENVAAVLEGRLEMPSGPTSISLSTDLKCNLACPTCRNTQVSVSLPHHVHFIQKELQLVMHNRESIEVIKLANSGEVFFSKEQRELLKSINRFDFPKLKYIFIVTNALLLNQQNYDQLFPGTSFIKKVAISIDAGDEDTYKVTRGGDWNRLLKNLEWIQMMRQKEEFLTVTFLFVVRKANFRSIDNFIKLGEKYGIDLFEFIEFDNWNDLYALMDPLKIDYKDEAIHIPGHPLRSELVEILSKYKHRSDVTINIDKIFD